MFNQRTMKQKARVMFLTLIGAILLGLAFGVLPLEEHSANAAPKEGKGGGEWRRQPMLITLKSTVVTHL